MSGADFTKKVAQQAIKNALAGYQNTVNNQAPAGPQIGLLSVDLKSATMPDGTIIPVQVIGSPAGIMGGSQGNTGGYAMIFPDGQGGGLAYWPAPRQQITLDGGNIGWLVSAQLNNTTDITINTQALKPDGSTQDPIIYQGVNIYLTNLITGASALIYNTADFTGLLPESLYNYFPQFPETITEIYNAVESYAAFDSTGHNLIIIQPYLVQDVPGTVNFWTYQTTVPGTDPPQVITLPTQGFPIDITQPQTSLYLRYIVFKKISLASSTQTTKFQFEKIYIGDVKLHSCFYAENSVNYVGREYTSEEIVGIQETSNCAMSFPSTGGVVFAFNNETLILKGITTTTVTVLEEDVINTPLYISGEAVGEEACLIAWHNVFAGVLNPAVTGVGNQYLVGFINGAEGSLLQVVTEGGAVITSDPSADGMVYEFEIVQTPISNESVVVNTPQVNETNSALLSSFPLFYKQYLASVTLPPMYLAQTTFFDGTNLICFTANYGYHFTEDQDQDLWVVVLYSDNFTPIQTSFGVYATSGIPSGDPNQPMGFYFDSITQTYKIATIGQFPNIQNYLPISEYNPPFSSNNIRQITLSGTLNAIDRYVNQQITLLYQNQDAAGNVTFTPGKKFFNSQLLQQMYIDAYIK